MNWSTFVPENVDRYSALLVEKSNGEYYVRGERVRYSERKHYYAPLLIKAAKQVRNKRNKARNKRT